MEITTTQHIKIEFDDGSTKELSEQEAKELHLALKSHFEPAVYGLTKEPVFFKFGQAPKPKGPENTVFKDSNLFKNINNFNWKVNTVNFTKIPTDIEPLNVEVKTTNDNIVTKVDYENGTVNGKPAASLFR